MRLKPKRSSKKLKVEDKTSKRVSPVQRMRPSELPAYPQVVNCPAPVAPYALQQNGHPTCASSHGDGLKAEPGGLRRPRSRTRSIPSCNKCDPTLSFFVLSC